MKKTRKSPSIWVWILAVALLAAFLLSVASLQNIFWRERPLSDYRFKIRNPPTYQVMFEQYASRLLTIPTAGDRWDKVQITHKGRHLLRMSSLNEVLENGPGAFTRNDRSLHIFPLSPEDNKTHFASYTVHFPLHATPLLILLLGSGTALTFLGGILIPPAINKHGWKSATWRISMFSTYGTSLLLFGLNILGLFIPLRNPDIYAEPLLRHNNEITLTYQQARAALIKIKGETPIQFATRANEIISDGMAHYWRDEGNDKYRIRIPAWENYILWSLSYLSPEYAKYKFADHRRGLERGVGMCGQQASVLVGFLREQGFQAQEVQLSGHTVSTAEIEKGEWHILDPDYRVHLPMDLATIENAPDIIRPYYESALLPFGESPKQMRKKLDHLVNVYEKNGNKIASLKKLSRPLKEENFIYRLKWLIPSILLVIGCILNLAMLRPKRIRV